MDIVDADPLLRLYCAVESSGPVIGLGSGSIPIGTASPEWIAATVKAIALTGRILLDRHGLVVPVNQVGVEAAIGNTVFGRILLPPDGAVPATPSNVGELARLADAARELADAFTYPAERDATRDLVNEVWRAQWRHCGPGTVALLGADSFLRPHAVSPGQDAVLTAVIDRVVQATRHRRNDPSARRPAVMLDVDLCTLVPRSRTHTALALVGAHFGIAEFTEAESLTLLPTYHHPSWQAYCVHIGLWKRYPNLDREAVFDMFWEEFFNPWDRMRDDEPLTGLGRFVWDVQDAGGEVVFNTGRRERVREHTEDALARAGILRPRLAMMPDDRTRPVAECKAENLRSFGDLDIVAVFDDLLDNRRALAKELPDAIVIAVAPPGFAAEPADDGAEVVTSFERIPRTGRTGDLRRGSALSDTRSLAELDIRELGDHTGAATAHAVRLDAAESGKLVSTLLAHSDTTAERLAANAVKALPSGDPLDLIHHILTRERFRKGPRGNLTVDAVRENCAGAVERGEPIPVVTFGFPVKLHYNDLKTAGTRPDLSELGALVRLREIQVAVREVYAPGLRITVLTDGNHFQPRPAALLSAYHDKLAEYHRMIGGTEFIDLVDVEEIAAERLGAAVIASRDERVDTEIARLDAVLAGLDVRHAPITVLAEATRRCGLRAEERGDGTPMPGFEDLFRSLMYVTPLDPPSGVPCGVWARLVYADLFHINDSGASPQVRASRADVLAGAWRRTVRYLAVLVVDRDLGYDDSTLFPGRIRLTPNPRPGALGFTYLGGAGVLPWHGTAAVDPQARLSTDFAVALSDRGYVPVYSALLDDVQPWFMTPSTLVSGGRLDPAVRDGIQLRRR